MIKVLLLMLLLTSANAQEQEPYPETIDIMKAPLSQWELTVVTRYEMIDIAHEYWTRKSCMKDGIRRIEEDMKPKEFGEPVFIGFICEWIKQPRP